VCRARRQEAPAESDSPLDSFFAPLVLCPIHTRAFTAASVEFNVVVFLERSRLACTVHMPGVQTRTHEMSTGRVHSWYFLLISTTVMTDG
jgi:hypothetical protein